jgi:hypothetical protein
MSACGALRPHRRAPERNHRYEAEFDRIKAIEKRANKLGIKINLSYDFGAVGRTLRNDAREA